MKPFLRDTIADAAQLDLAELEVEFDRAFAESDERELMRIYGAIGELTRINGGDGRPMIEQALELAHRLDDARGVIANRIRMAIAHFYRGEHAFAELELHQVIADIEDGSDTTYLDYAWQHLGKCIAEQERYQEAIKCFERALLLRTDPRLRASSQEAIAAARRRMHDRGR
jgi:tetratricopeptide (TPR) repeat protein